MPIEQMIPDLLDHVDVERWERPAALVRLIAQLAVPPCPVPVDRALLLALERTAAQAKYDHEVLVRLAERDRVLKRWVGRGRNPDCWSINPDLSRWRNVPWKLSQRAVIRLFLARSPENAMHLWGERAAQRAHLWGNTPPNPGSEPDGLSVNHHPSSAHDHPTSAHSPGETGARSPHNGTDPAAAHYASNSLKPSLPYPPQRESENRGREGGSEQSPLLAQIVARISQVIGCPVIGAPRARITAAVEATIPDGHTLLLEMTNRLAGIRTASGAAAAFEGLAAELAGGTLPARPDVGAQLRGIRQQIANYLQEGVEADEPLIQELRSREEVLKEEYDRADG